ncbi:hypothetical protein DFJ74DRAFT_669476 [Hyaloraphidium curvatum]|nr:hypothetical protein DFJ74DRAFT_669476 [Hyaloraphidium curvatum]
MQQFTHFVVVGAGPAGLLAAAGLSRRGHTVDVYEGRPNLDQAPEESYPIGLNLRGMRAVERVAGVHFSERLKAEGELVDEWAIMGGNWKVASVVSGACYSHTRYAVAKACYDAATVGVPAPDAGDSGSEASTADDSASRVKVFFGKRLSSYDAPSRTLHFADGSLVALDGNAGLVAADGVWSAVRKGLVVAPPSGHPLDKTIVESVIPWAQRFRVMFMDKGHPASLNPAVHYIYNGVYTAVTGSNSRWSVVPGCKDGDAHQSWFDSTEATPENVESLRKYLCDRIPPVKDNLSDFFSDEELRAFFTRRIFTGALTHVSWPASGGHTVLLGDAAHGLFPATGEGVNSALDDVAVLMDCLDAWNGAPGKPLYEVPRPEGARSFLDLYAAARQPAINALHALAKDVMLMQNGSGKEKAVQILGAIFTKWGGRKETEAELRYGPASRRELLPYEEIVARHYEQVEGARKWARWLVSPFSEIKPSAFSSVNADINIANVARAVRAK